MSNPTRALRQPKHQNATNQVQQPKPQLSNSTVPQVIVTLKSDKKLVLPSDAYHGILTAGEVYKCVFCNLELKLNENMKEMHKNSTSHMEFLKNYPHIEEFSENLLRQVAKDKVYCTVCNVEVLPAFITHHITSDVHNNALQRAIARALIYKPCS